MKGLPAETEASTILSSFSLSPTTEPVIVGSEGAGSEEGAEDSVTGAGIDSEDDSGDAEAGSPEGADSCAGAGCSCCFSSDFFSFAGFSAFSSFFSCFSFAGVCCSVGVSAGVSAFVGSAGCPAGCYCDFV
ncbi:hypothetical protein HYT26_00885 [Candidatus Pacearchaeota archaeon]|nr:hypothetical protein [Candidatus Pacearchaeota archaeon]